MHFYTKLSAFISAILLSAAPLLCVNALEAGPTDINISYIGDIGGNASGGIKTGFAYHGRLWLGAKLYTDKIKAWKGGELYVQLGNTHGNQASLELLGDYMIASNIEAGNHTFMEQLWYRQQIGQVSLQAGLIDINNDFMIVSEAGMLLNSSYGTHATISGNLWPPIFPLTNLGFIINYQPTEQLCLRGAVFNGAPRYWDENPYNLNWEFSKQKGVFSVIEAASTYQLFSNLSSSYKLGAYLYWNETEGQAVYNPGWYLNLEQEVLHTASDASVSLFSQLSWAPPHQNYLSVYASLGTHASGFWKQRSSDEAALSVCMAYFQDFRDAELNIEATYRFYFWQHYYLQPDIQFILHPKGISNAPHALWTALRFGIDF